MSTSRIEQQSIGFAALLQVHMEAWCDEVGQHPLLWARWTNGVHPTYRKLTGGVMTDNSARLHEYAAHLRSS